jgi:hypothetical protein
MTFQKHIDAITSGEVTKTNIIGLRKALNTSARRRAGLSVSTTSPNVSEDDIHLALALIDRERPKVGGELHDSGVKLLQNKRYAKRLAEYEDVIAWPSHFELCGFDRLGLYGHYAVPVYRLVGQNGGSFKFRNIPWQSGGDGPELV